MPALGDASSQASLIKFIENATFYGKFDKTWYVAVVLVSTVLTCCAGALALSVWACDTLWNMLRARGFDHKEMRNNFFEHQREIETTRVVCFFFAAGNDFIRGPKQVPQWSPLDWKTSVWENSKLWCPAATTARSWFLYCRSFMLIPHCRCWDVFLVLSCRLKVNASCQLWHHTTRHKQLTRPPRCISFPSQTTDVVCSANQEHCDNFQALSFRPHWYFLRRLPCAAGGHICWHAEREVVAQLCGVLPERACLLEISLRWRHFPI